MGRRESGQVEKWAGGSAPALTFPLSHFPTFPPAVFCKTVTMQESRAITRKSASNLALAFVLLPRAKREGMTALYAFCREVDDVADEETTPVEQRRHALAAWREDIARACSGVRPELPVNQELQPVIAPPTLESPPIPPRSRHRAPRYRRGFPAACAAQPRRHYLGS